MLARSRPSLPNWRRASRRRLVSSNLSPRYSTEYFSLINNADTVSTTLGAAKSAIESAAWFSYEELDVDFQATLGATIDEFNLHASGDGLDPMGRGVPDATAYESSVAWWKEAFSFARRGSHLFDACPE